MNDDVIAADGDQRDVQRRRDDNDRAEERVPEADLVREPPVTVDVGFDVERHHGDVEDEVGHRQ